MNSFFGKKSRIICLAWAVIGIILLVAIYLFKNTSLQDAVGTIVLCYVFGSCILSGVAACVSKKEKQE